MKNENYTRKATQKEKKNEYHKKKNNRKMATLAIIMHI